jgi:hypothetical protein
VTRKKIFSLSTDARGSALIPSSLSEKTPANVRGARPSREVFARELWVRFMICIRLMARCVRGLPLGVGFFLFVACGGSTERTSGRAINIGEYRSPETFIYKNNLWFAADDVANSEPTSAYGGASVTGTLAPADPGFTDAPAGHFAIESSSPVAAAGIDLKEVPADYRGACYATPRAVGAFEVLE